MGLFSLLIKPNSTVEVQQGRTAQDASGGSTVDFSTVVATAVPCVISLTKGSRDGRFEGDANLAGGQLTGDDAALARQDTRIKVLTSSVPGLAGAYLRADDVTSHPPSPSGWVPARYTVQWSRWSPSA